MSGFSRSIGTICLAISCLMLAPTWAQQQKDKSTSPRQIDNILAEVQIALLKAQTDAATKNLPKLASVILELETEFEYSAGGELKLYVVSASGKIKNDRSQRMTVTLQPPKPFSEQQISSGSISESLSTAIIAAAEGIAGAQKRKPPLVVKKLEAEIKFIVKESGEGGIKVELLPIAAGLSGDISRETTQRIVISFENETK